MFFKMDAQFQPIPVEDSIRFRMPKKKFFFSYFALFFRFMRISKGAGKNQIN